MLIIIGDLIIQIYVETAWCRFLLCLAFFLATESNPFSIAPPTWIMVAHYDPGSVQGVYLLKGGFLLPLLFAQHLLMEGCCIYVIIS